jgi:quinol monooxygenase YgiN
MYTLAQQVQIAKRKELKEANAAKKGKGKEAKEGEADALAEILRDMTPPTMAEPKVKLFLPYRSPTNPALFFVFELYVDESGWAAHEATDHFKAAVKALITRVTRRERVPFIPFL